MSIRLTRLLTADEYVAMGDEAVAKGWYRNDRRMFTPGMAWPNPWYWDPTGERERAGKHVMVKERGHLGFLSIHYWRDWADKRAPLTVVLPNGETWCMDQKSSNGDGWKVEGDFPNITATPSIAAHGYHGFLREGQFTPDVDGRGPNGFVRPIEERKA